MMGRTVIVPEDPQQICALNPFCAPFVVAFGHGESMKATVNAIKRDVLIQAICPSLKDAVVVKNSGSVNAEAVLALGVDLIFLEEGTYINDDERAKLDALNIPYLVLKNSTIEEAMESILLMGKVLNAEERAEQYVAYYRTVLQDVAEIVAGIPEDERPNLYHSVNEATRTDFPGSITAEWVAYSGVNNVSIQDDGKLNLSGDSAYTTLEQIFVWDPEVIICNEPGVANYILTDSKWVGLQAVKDGKVYQMPVGITRWGHPNSTETPLALIWLVETIYPDCFEYDLGEETKKFYKNFFDYDLDDEMLKAVLSGEGMRSPKTNTSVE
ncbi:MAG: ABC transporter substrate-binding protein [Firmicutes bacterium]|nr:ABC transporter substrate-binding protein [Bacillota bacterium]